MDNKTIWRKPAERMPAPFRMFRDLNDKEEQEFRDHARENYVIGSPIDSFWHPQYRDECHIMNSEV